jgi:6-phosphogluconolactonase
VRYEPFPPSQHLRPAGNLLFDGLMNLPRMAGWMCAASLLAGVPDGTAAASEGSATLSLAKQPRVYIGTYTGPKSKGIYVSRFDVATGTLSAPELAAETVNPTFLAVPPGDAGRSSTRPLVLYAANETGWGGKSGTISAFTIDHQTGRLTLLNSQSSRGGGPCHLSVDPSGQCVLAANYGSGSVAALPVRGDGSLGEAMGFFQHAGTSVNPKRQEGPHAHFIQADRSDRFALVCDLGLDQILVYRLNAAKATLEANNPPFAKVKPGAGPRHLAFTPDGGKAYLINELDSTVTGFSYEARRGVLREFQTVSTLPEGCTNQNSTAEIALHPSGRFLYGSNRGHNSIAVFALDQKTGQMSLVQHQSTLGKTPRNFTVHPSGRWLLAANQDTDNVVVFSIDPATGRLTPTGQGIEVGAPVCLLFAAVPDK